jgi:protein-L-isoaspartate(D-aspartate) O-methyltransferase
MNMNFEQARFNMVEQQIRPWEVLDARVLSLLQTIPREDFVPVQYRKLAFADMAIPMEADQVMMRPKIEARMLQALDVQADETVLEIGTGSGFITACLAAQAQHVVSVEIFEELHREAKARLDARGVTNVEYFRDDAMGDWQPEQAHDVVVVTGSVPSVPESFLGWVNPGGRMFVVRGESPAMEACLMTRKGVGEWLVESLFETDLPRLVNATPEPEFEF